MSATLQEERAGTAAPRVALDGTAWAGRAMYFDILALLALLLSAVAAGLNIYNYLIAGGVRSGGARALAPLGISLLAFVLSYTWIASRLVRAGYREVAGR